MVGRAERWKHKENMRALKQQGRTDRNSNKWNARVDKNENKWNAKVEENKDKWDAKKDIAENKDNNKNQWIWPVVVGGVVVAGIVILK